MHTITNHPRRLLWRRPMMLSGFQDRSTAVGDACNTNTIQRRSDAFSKNIQFACVVIVPEQDACTVPQPDGRRCMSACRQGFRRCRAVNCDAPGIQRRCARVHANRMPNTSSWAVQENALAPIDIARWKESEQRRSGTQRERERERDSLLIR